MIKQKLLGSWTLTAFWNVTEDGTRAPWTGTLSGRLIYTATGVVSVAINRSKQLPDGGVVEHNSFYCGRFELPDEETVVHHVAQSSDLGRIGDRYVRKLKLEGDTLALHGLGLTGQVHLRWVRDGRD